MPSSSLKLLSGSSSELVSGQSLTQELEKTSFMFPEVHSEKAQELGVHCNEGSSFPTFPHKPKRKKEKMAPFRFHIIQYQMRLLKNYMLNTGPALKYFSSHGGRYLILNCFIIFILYECRLSNL